MDFSIKNLDLESLNHEFSEITFSYYESDFDGFMGCIAANFKNAADVIQYWDEVQSMAATFIQPQNHFAKWNIYFAIFCAESIPISDKYFIQNDKFIMRKIVFDDLSQLPSEDKTLKTINNVILGADLEINEYEIEKLKAPNFDLADFIKPSVTDGLIPTKELKRAVLANIIDTRILKNEN